MRDKVHFDHHWAKHARHALLALGLLSGLQAGAEGVGANATGGSTWQEDVLLHDGRTIVAERYVRRGGRAEIGQSGAYVEQRLSFSDPATSKTYSWSDTRGAERGMTNFLLLALHVVSDVPYVVATPMGCQAYNQWGRPNPPYVVFMAQGNGWKRISLADLPPQAVTANLVHSAPDEWVRRHGTRHVTAAQIQQENATNQPQYRSILREPVSSDAISCRLEFTNGKGLWLGADWFSDKPNLASCQKFCEREEFAGDTCPCKQFFQAD